MKDEKKPACTGIMFMGSHYTFNFNGPVHIFANDGVSRGPSVAVERAAPVEEVLVTVEEAKNESVTNSDVETSDAGSESEIKKAYKRVKRN